MTDLDGMVRKPDHSTSVAAAKRVSILTLRATVIDAAFLARFRGITDDDLKALHPNSPESSLRKRRTELTQENVILDAGRTRENRHGQHEKVWLHRDFYASPPPVVPPVPKRDRPISKARQIAELETRVRDLDIAIRQALRINRHAAGYSEARVRMADTLKNAL